MVGEVAREGVVQEVAERQAVAPKAATQPMEAPLLSAAMMEVESRPRSRVELGKRRNERQWEELPQSVLPQSATADVAAKGLEVAAKSIEDACGSSPCGSLVASSLTEEPCHQLSGPDSLARAPSGVSDSRSGLGLLAGASETVGDSECCCCHAFNDIAAEVDTCGRFSSWLCGRLVAVWHQSE